MGIPMYREPSSTEATKSDNVKDSCAAARSAIRRQGAVRRSRYGGSGWRSTTLRSPFPRPQLDEIEREASGLPRHSHSPISIPPRPSDPFDLNSSLADNGRRLRMIDDALHRNRSGHRLRMPRSSTFSDLLNPLPPSAGDANTRLEPHDHLHLTPRFAPAIAYHRSSTPLAGSDLLRRSPLSRHEGLGEEAQAGSFIPSLRRVGQRSFNDTNLTSRGPPIDGLGDRQRSVDLEDDHANDAWETLLTTIAPDANLPSADSSFNSASAPGTDGSPNETSRSSATSLEPIQNSLHPTVPTIQMTLDPYQEYTHPCDYPSSTDTDTESDGETVTQRSLYRRYRRSRRQYESLRRASNRQSLTNNPTSIPTISFAFSDSSGDQDLQNMQAILDRLARREPIPDDWWAATGLSRTMDQRAGAGDEVVDNFPGPDGPVGHG
ncbi:uncharacterized protein DSM5745_11558 [Aspergillus mulundensis]|uniref:Uncharacterized protein n=1 Tax=Aspergillus mulundensis TaxID=1810919 RepID=A0A3D8Q665_9EURO|nr:Uncharacterized protein DSM5745_11558 [Aspergillus mulundensis]RDW57160.1 Uncharacterized protein DSM5745_11558 [Aspergillus mulundensis]